MPSGDSRMPGKNGLVAPRLVAAKRQKKTYPPLQWWPLRVMDPSHKLALLLGLGLVDAALVRLLGLAVPGTVVLIIIEPLWLVALIALVRSFRGEGEPVGPPRAWWRLTSRPRAGFLVATMYLLIAATQFAALAFTWTAWVGAVNAAFLGAAFLNSSIRLTMERRRAR